MKDNGDIFLIRSIINFMNEDEENKSLGILLASSIMVSNCLSLKYLNYD
jgi:hypothetical protein